MGLQEVMSDEVYTVTPQANLAHVRNIFLKKKVSHLLVYDGTLRGIITDGDLAEAFLTERRSIDAIPAVSVMSKSVVTAEPDESPSDIARTMVEKHISGIPVVRKGEVQGIVTKSDLVRHFADNFSGQVKVAELMSQHPKTIMESQSIFHAAREMKNSKVKRLIVTQDKKPIGVVSERDLSLATFGLHPTKVVFSHTGMTGMKHRNVFTYALIVRDVMQTNLVTAHAEEDAGKVARRILEKSVGSAIVKNGERLTGIVTKTDFVRWLARQA